MCDFLLPLEYIYFIHIYTGLGALLRSSKRSMMMIDDDFGFVCPKKNCAILSLALSLSLGFEFVLLLLLWDDGGKCERGGDDDKRRSTNTKQLRTIYFCNTVLTNLHKIPIFLNHTKGQTKQRKALDLCLFSLAFLSE